MANTNPSGMIALETWRGHLLYFVTSPLRTWTSHDFSTLGTWCKIGAPGCLANYASVEVHVASSSAWNMLCDHDVTSCVRKDSPVPSSHFSPAIFTLNLTMEHSKHFLTTPNTQRFIVEKRQLQVLGPEGLDHLHCKSPLVKDSDKLLLGSLAGILLVILCP